MAIDYYKCTECNGEAVDLECGYCNGSGEELDDNDEYIDCKWCDGSGSVYDEFECLECGHTYNTSDIETD